MKSSDERAFEEFVADFGIELMRFARLLFLDAGSAEDALQTALIRTAGHWGPRMHSPRAYVRKALVNLARDAGRRRHLQFRPVEVRDDHVASAPDHADAVAARESLDELLALLPPRQRVTVVLRVIDGLPEAETAQLMRCSPGTVKSNLARGLDRLREFMIAKDGTEVTCHD